MRITNVRVEPLAVTWADYFGGADKVPEQLWRPSANFTGVRRREGQFSTLVFVETDEGVTGMGESWGLPDPLISAMLIERLLAPLLTGQDPFAIDYLWDMMTQAVLDGTARPFLMEAISGVDIALWDLKGKALGLPIHRLMGGPYRTHIDIYASPVPFLPPVEAGLKAVEFVERGFRALKVKVARGMDTDLAFVAAIREAIGPDVAIMADANCGCTVPQAIQLGKRLSDYGVTWLEEPLPVADRAGLAEVRRALDMAVVSGENEHSNEGVLTLLQLGAIDAIQPNFTRIGGITGALRMAHLANAYGIPMAPHGVGSVVGIAAVLHTLASIPNFWIFEYNQLLNPLRDELAQQPLALDEGRLVVPTGPGLGIDLRTDLLERYRLRK